MTHDLDTCNRTQEGACHRCDRDSGCCLTCTGSFKHRTGVLEPVFLHSHKVCVSWSRSRQRCIPREIGQHSRVHWIR